MATRCIPRGNEFGNKTFLSFKQSDPDTVLYGACTDLPETRLISVLIPEGCLRALRAKCEYELMHCVSELDSGNLSTGWNRR